MCVCRLHVVMTWRANGLSAHIVQCVILLHNWPQSNDGDRSSFWSTNKYELFSLLPNYTDSNWTHASFRGQKIENCVQARLNASHDVKLRRQTHQASAHTHNYAHSATQYTRQRDDSRRIGMEQIYCHASYTHQSGNLFVGNISCIAMLSYYAMHCNHWRCCRFFFVILITSLIGI